MKACPKCGAGILRQETCLPAGTYTIYRCLSHEYSGWGDGEFHQSSCCKERENGSSTLIYMPDVVFGAVIDTETILAGKVKAATAELQAALARQKRVSAALSACLGAFAQNRRMCPWHVDCDDDADWPNRGCASCSGCRAEAEADKETKGGCNG